MCSESTEESITGWLTCSVEVRLEFWRKYETSYVQKTEVEVVPVVGSSDESAAFVFFSFCGRCNTGIILIVLSCCRVIFSQSFSRYDSNWFLLWSLLLFSREVIAQI